MSEFVDIYSVHKDGCLLKTGRIWDQFLLFEATFCFSFEFLFFLNDFFHKIMTRLSDMFKKIR